MWLWFGFGFGEVVLEAEFFLVRNLWEGVGGRIFLLLAGGRKLGRVFFKVVF